MKSAVVVLCVLMSDGLRPVSLSMKLTFEQIVSEAFCGFAYGGGKVGVFVLLIVTCFIRRILAT